jgi:1,2-diacylglycerol 3-alpha-glucosyltransferase
MPGNLLLQRLYRLFFPLDILKNRRYARLLGNFSTIYSHQYPMNWLACLAKKDYKVKYIYYDYGVAPPESFSSIIERVYIWIFTSLSDWTARRADNAISISQYLKFELKNNTGLNSDVIYPTIDTKRFHPGIDASEIRKKHSLGDRQVILYVGRISPHKGIHLLIESFRQARKQVPQAALLIVGKHTFPEYSRKLKQMADKNVIFAGCVSDEDVPLYYAACDIYASATLWEGFDLPLAEAQSCGKPVIAFNIGPHPEVVSHRKTGLLVDESDTFAMAEAMIKLLSDKDLRRKMGNEAAAIIRERFA